MVISSLVVEADPPRVQRVADELARMAGVEVHEINGYKIVVTIEADSVSESHATASGFVAVDGVLNVNLVYLNCEDENLEG